MPQPSVLRVPALRVDPARQLARWSPANIDARYLAILAVLAVLWLAALVSGAGAFERAHLTIAAVGGLAVSGITAIGVTGRERRVRGWIALAFVGWSAGELLRTAAFVLGQPALHGLGDVCLVVVGLGAVGAYHSALSGKLPRREEIAVYLDAAIVVLAAIALMFAAWGDQLDNATTTSLFLHAVVFCAILGATIILDLATVVERRMRGAYLVLAGVAVAAVAFLGRAATVEPDKTAAPIFGVLLAAGVFAVAGGSATWHDRPDGSVAFVHIARRLRETLPLLAAALLPIVLLGVVIGHGGQGIHPSDVTVTVAAALGLVVAVVRQSLMLREREEVLVRLERAVATSDRTARQMAGVEEVGRLLAEEGPTHAVLDKIVGVLVDRFGYEFVSIYLLEGDTMRLGAQRGYDDPIELFPRDTGVIGRVWRTRQPQYVPDVAADADYRAGSPNVRSEVSVPLLAGDELLGVLNVESTGAVPLGPSEVAAMIAVGDQLAAALTLGIERRSLREERDFVSTVFDTVGSLLVVTDREGRILRFNTACQEITGYTFDDVRGRRYWEVVLAPEDVESVRAVFSNADPSVFPNRNENDWITRTGERRRISWQNTALLDEDGRVRYLIGSGIDVTERQKLQAQLEHQAFHDALTGLPNRRFLVERLRRALERRRVGPVALLFIDLDDFKIANDTLGHAGGDAVLLEVARRLRRALRSADLPARLGGDEFALLLEDAESRDAVAAVAERLLETLRRPIRVRGREVQVAASIGIAFGDGHRERGEELLRNADLAMYAAKSKGKDRYTIYAPSMHAELTERREIAQQLRQAVERDEFVLHYQPIVDLEHGGIVGVEALVRWNRPGAGLLGPATFIAIAEETGLIVPIGAVVLRRAMRDAVGWADATDRAPWLSVNLSARQFADPGLVDLVAGALRDTGLDPARLVLEITESSLMQETEVTIERLGALKRLGVRLAVDDFGTGYSSLSYLRRFPIDILKIDRSFVNASTERPGRELTLASAVVAIGASLGLQTIAEGIETAEQQEALVWLGCRLGQGYLFARPVEAAAIPRLLDPTESLVA